MDEEVILQLASLSQQLSDAKATENSAKSNRIAVEEKIAALIPGKEKGQVTVKLPDGTKITVERGFNYKADVQAILDLFHPEDTDKFAPVKVKTERTLDETGYEWYRENDQDTFTKLSHFVVITPKKVSVTLKAAK